MLCVCSRPSTRRVRRFDRMLVFFLASLRRALCQCDKGCNEGVPRSVYVTSEALGGMKCARFGNADITHCTTRISLFEPKYGATLHLFISQCSNVNTDKM